jgi:hypothetical protein
VGETGVLPLDPVEAKKFKELQDQAVRAGMLSSPQGLEQALAGGMTMADVVLQGQILKVAMQQMELNEKNGLLLEKDKAVDAWNAWLVALRVRAEAAPARYAPNFAAALGLDKAGEMKVMELMETMVRGLLEDTVRDPFLELAAAPQ